MEWIRKIALGAAALIALWVCAAVVLWIFGVVANLVMLSLKVAVIAGLLLVVYQVYRDKKQR